MSSEQAINEYKNFMIYFMAEIAARASRAGLPGDLCIAINTKIARHLYKIRSKALSFIEDRTLLVSQSTRDK